MEQRPEGQISWELQTAYEDLVLARGHVIKVVREIRSVVKEPRNRTAVRRRGRTPYYTDPEDAVAALRSFSHLAYLIHPGRQNRISPDALLQRYENALGEVTALEERVDELERELAEQYLPAQ